MKSYASMLLVVLSLAACAKTEAPPEPVQAPEAKAAPAADAPALPVPDELAKKVQGVADKAAALADVEAPALTAEQYEALLLGLGGCKVTDSGHIEPACPALKEFDQARRAKTALKDLAGMMGPLGRKHIGHESAAVRVKAAQLMGSMFGADAGTQQVILEAIGKELEPAVVRAMLEVVGSRGKANPEVGKLLLAQAGHASPLVRRAALGWLATSFNQGLPGGVEKLIAAIEKDPDPEVRRFACENAGKLADDKLLKIYERGTADTKDPKLYAACMRGLVRMWLFFPFFENANRKAYELTLKRLAARPRSKDLPPWTLMNEFRHLGQDSDKVKAWKAKAAWYDQAKLVAAIQQVVEDPAANWMARNGGVESLLGLGAPKATFDAMLGKCGDRCDAQVKRKLEEAAAKAK